MCGIHGFTYKNIDHIKKMIELSHHRGPDANNYFFDESVTLGHNLLSIVNTPDISVQPWVTKKGNVLVFNGEIYNYQKLGNGNLDTEVLAEGLDEHGINFTKKLDGMFAFAWYNPKEEKLYLVRDHFGVKHLYHTFKDGALIFSSELKSLLGLGVDRTLDKFATGLFFRLGYVPGYKTMLKSVNKLSPGEIFCYDLKTRKISKDTLHTKQINIEHKYEAEEVRGRFSNAVRSTMMGRRPIGLYLSGGLDSSSILHELVKYQNIPTTFTTKFRGWHRKENNDASVAYFASKHYKTEHHEVLISKEDFCDNIDNYIDAVEFPIRNINGPAYYLANKAQSEAGRIVTLAGDGGDEIYTGYAPHGTMGLNTSLYNAENRVLLKNFIKQFGKGEVKFNDPEFDLTDDQIIDYILEWFPIHCFGDDYLNNILFFSLFMQLSEDYMLRNDKLGMRFSMEGRFPHILPSYVFYILSISSREKLLQPKNWKVDGTYKYLMRNTYRNLIPNRIINKFKSGWTAPSDSWDKYIQMRTSDLYNSKSGCSSDPLLPWDSFLTEGFNKKRRSSFIYFRAWMRRFKVSV